MVNHYASLEIFDDKLIASYVSDDETMLRYTYPYGHRYFESRALGVQAISALESALISLLEQISLYERIPLEVRIESMHHKEWLKRVIESRSYAQFYTGGKPIRGTLLNIRSSSLPYARHSQTLLSFKV